MHLIRIFIVSLLLSFNLPVSAQFEKIAEIKARAEFFSTDRDGNIYYTDHDSLVKLTPPYHHYFSFQFSQHQLPDFIDLSNPKQIICLFRENQFILLLDSTLKTVLRPFYLDELGMYDIFAAVSTSNMGIWFYNIYTNSLVKLNSNFMPEVRSVKLNNFFSSPHLPSFLLQYNDELFIDVPSTGILVLDNNGIYKTAYNLQGIPDFQVLNNDIYYYRDHFITELSLPFMKARPIHLPDTDGIINAHYHPGYLIIQKPDEILVYRTNAEKR
jgi:hypothetical protein